MSESAREEANYHLDKADLEIEDARGHLGDDDFVAYRRAIESAEHHLVAARNQALALIVERHGSKD